MAGGPGWPVVGSGWRTVLLLLLGLRWQDSNQTLAVPEQRDREDLD